MTRIKKYIAFLLAPLLCGCMDWEYSLSEDLSSAERGLFIASEGNFQYGNASLSFYDPATGVTQNEVFLRANGFKLGDVAQSMTMHGRECWIAVNHSHVVFAIDAETFKETGRIEGLTSPRYIHFVNDRKAYITQLWDNRIAVINPQRRIITGYIGVPSMAMETGSTEQMAQWGRYVYCNCWSYQNRIIKIDTVTDAVVDELEVGLQPQSLVIDSLGKLWTVTATSLVKIDAETFTIEQTWDFPGGEPARELQTDASGRRLYWIRGDVWQMGVEETELPSRPLIETRGTIYYGLTVSPYNGDVYIADAIDYQQSGKIYRYTAAGHLIDEFYVGVIPGSFCWR